MRIHVVFGIYFRKPLAWDLSLIFKPQHKPLCCFPVRKTFYCFFHSAMKWSAPQARNSSMTGRSMGTVPENSAIKAALPPLAAVSIPSRTEIPIVFDRLFCDLVLKPLQRPWPPGFLHYRLGWVVVKELNLSYHNGYIYIVNHRVSPI